ncbi:PIN domain-containing protein [Candidatus Woesearchaeota archaeon]|nr:PIN domain-containing protein [Candidatus Woesearchaeota archaeon]
MKLVVDTNRIIAALVRDGSSREVITKNHTFITTDFSIEEINKHKKEILDKSGMDEPSFDLLIALLFYNIEIVPYSEYKEHIKEARDLMKERDIKDIPFLALALAKKADGIWSDDRDFESQNKIKIFKTKDLI